MSIEKKQQIQYLLLQYLDGVATDKEESLLFSLLEQEPNNKEWEPLIEELIAAEPELSDYRREEWQPIIQTILKQNTNKVIDIDINRRKLWRRIAVAASIVLVLGFGGYFMFFNKKSTADSQQSIAKTTDVEAPKVTKAMITLADGRTIAIDSLTTIDQSDVTITKTPDGKIIYSHEGTKTQSELQYNTLVNPRGSKVIDMTLADGSRVWLNAGSSVTYPVAFIGNERKVEITGEAYFEVKSEKSKVKNGNNPFIVQKGETFVEVLGTHFNVNAYDNESDIKVTLLEGSVRVTSASSAKNFAPSAVKIKPGEQAVAMSNGQLAISKAVDIDQVMAWKDNRFYFMSADIRAIARQLERWYDVDITIDQSVSGKFTGIISRSVNASEVFRMLQQTGTMQVKIEGKKIEISK